MATRWSLLPSNRQVTPTARALPSVINIGFVFFQCRICLFFFLIYQSINLCHFKIFSVLFKNSYLFWSALSCAPLIINTHHVGETCMSGEHPDCLSAGVATFTGGHVIFISLVCCLVTWKRECQWSAM